MSRSSNIVRVTMAFVASTLIAAPTLAQSTTAPRTSGGLFGPTRSGIADRDSLNFTFSLNEAIDSEAPAELRSRVAQRDPQGGGYSTMFVGSADYARNRRRIQLAGTAQTAFRYYDRLDKVDAVGHTAGFGASVRLPKRASLQVSQTAAYSPSYLFQLFPTATVPSFGDAIPAAPDYRVDNAESYSYGTRMTLAMGSTRNRLSASADYNRTDFQTSTATRSDLMTYGSQVKLSRGVARNGRLSIGYEYRAGELGFGDLSEHRLAIGVEYSRALSVRRRATFRFNFTPSTLDISESAPNALVSGPGYRLQGEASVDYQFKRTWHASGSYRRSLEYVAVLTDPVFADAARAELSGLITRRVDLSAAAGYAIGQSAINRGNQFDTYTGNMTVRFALARSLALYTEYLYYYYDLRDGTSLAPDLPRVFTQHGARVGLTLWVPAF